MTYPIETYEYDYPPHVEGFWEDVKKAVTPPKHIRKAVERMFTLPKKIRKKLKLPKNVKKFLAKAMYPPKIIRKALIKPKWLRRNPWLDKAMTIGIEAIAFIPFPGARIVSASLSVIDEMSDMGAEIEQIKRETRRAAAQEAQIIVAEEADLSRGIPRKGFLKEERSEAMHELALWAAQQHNAGNFEDAEAARQVYEEARFSAPAQDMVVMMVFGNPAIALHEETVKATQQGLQETEVILDALPSSIQARGVEMEAAARAPMAPVMAVTPVTMAPALVPVAPVIKSKAPPWGLLAAGVVLFLILR